MIDGTSATYGLRKFYLATGNTSKIFRGDPIKVPVAGVVDVATSTSTAIAGIFESFEWTSIAEQKVVRRNWWNGAGDAVSGTTVTAYGYSNPGSIFEVQCILGPITAANISQFATFNAGSGGTQIGAGNQSSYTLDTAGMSDTQGTLIFRIYDLPTQNVLFTQSGYDPANPYNRVWVTMVNLSPE